MVLEEWIKQWNDGSEVVEVQTSGSTGVPKTIALAKEMMRRSAVTTCDFLGLKAGDTALLCLSLAHIAGKMMVVRSLVRGLELVCVSPCGHPLRGMRTAPTFAAMVPMQVYNSLCVAEEREVLRQIRHLIIGGSSIDASLAAQLKDFPHAVWSTYGMTETCSHIALRRLNGATASEWYMPFDAIGVQADDEGCLVISQPVEGIDAQGAFLPAQLHTNDIVRFHPDGRRFCIIGRKDNVIISGGIKIQAEEVEGLLRPYLDVPFLITGKRDEKFGEIVVLMLEKGDVEAARQVCQNVLPKFRQPRLICSVEQLPRTETGKLKRERL